MPNRRPRTEFTKATKVQAWDRSGGNCEGCGCKLFAGQFDYDHVLETSQGGDASLENCAVLCKSCHGLKTKERAPVIAKLRRVEEKHLGIKKPKGWSRTLNGRPIKQKVDGTVVYSDTGEAVR